MSRILFKFFEFLSGIITGNITTTSSPETSEASGEMIFEGVVTQTQGMQVSAAVSEMVFEGVMETTSAAETSDGSDVLILTGTIATRSSGERSSGEGDTEEAAATIDPSTMWKKKKKRPILRRLPVYKKKREDRKALPVGVTEDDAEAIAIIAQLLGDPDLEDLMMVTLQAEAEELQEAA